MLNKRECTCRQWKHRVAAEFEVPEPKAVLDRIALVFFFYNSSFLIREDSDETLYFSCKAHLDELISSLEDDGKEKRLLSALKAKYKTMVKHMEITEALTEAARGRTVDEMFCLP